MGRRFLNIAVIVLILAVVLFGCGGQAATSGHHTATTQQVSTPTADSHDVGTPSTHDETDTVNIKPEDLVLNWDDVQNGLFVDLGRGGGVKKLPQEAISVVNDILSALSATGYVFVEPQESFGEDAKLFVFPDVEPTQEAVDKIVAVLKERVSRENLDLVVPGVPDYVDIWAGINTGTFGEDPDFNIRITVEKISDDMKRFAIQLYPEVDTAIVAYGFAWDHIWPSGDFACIWGTVKSVEDYLNGGELYARPRMVLGSLLGGETVWPPVMSEIDMNLPVKDVDTANSVLMLLNLESVPDIQAENTRQGTVCGVPVSAVVQDGRIFVTFDFQRYSVGKLKGGV